ncbi:hypothetical protein [Bacillus sp. D48C]
MKKELTPRELESKEAFVEVSKIFLNADYTDYEIFTYTIIEGLSRNPIGAAHTGVNQLIMLMGMFANTSLKSKVKETLEGLREYDLIEIYEDNMLTKKVNEIKQANSYFIKIKEKERNLGFTKVFYSDLHKILALDNTYRVKIYRVYYEIMSHIFYNDSSSRIAFPNIDTISEITGIDRKSVMKYTKILMENKILICLKIRKDKKKDKNYYSRWIHKDEITGTIQQDNNEHGGTVCPIWAEQEVA